MRNIRMPTLVCACLAYFLARRGPWGVGVEFIHSKIYLETGQTVQT